MYFFVGENGTSLATVKDSLTDVQKLENAQYHFFFKSVTKLNFVMDMMEKYPFTTLHHVSLIFKIGSSANLLTGHIKHCLGTKQRVITLLKEQHLLSSDDMSSDCLHLRVTSWPREPFFRPTGKGMGEIKRPSDSPHEGIEVQFI